MYHGFHKYFKQHNCYQHWYIIIRDVSWAENQLIRMISEGSCDTEDWSNGAEIQRCIRGINYIFIYIQL